MSQKKNYFQRIVELFAGNNYPASVRSDFFRWLTDEEHATEKDKALKKLWETTRSTADTEISIHTWKRIRKSIGLLPEKNFIQRIRIWQGAAAVLLLMLASSLYLASIARRPSADLIQQYVPIAETGCFLLPDGSQVQLNSKSTLLYPQNFSGKTRSVYLIGEANFKVAHDKKHPFIVKSADLQVTALGTEFNVSAYPDNPVTEATLISGSIRVEYDNLQSSEILKPNEQLAYNRIDKNRLRLIPDMNDVTAWQRDELVFKEMTLTDIIRVLERKYPYQFEYSLNSLGNDKYTFRFREKAALPEVMDIIESVVGNIKYKIEGNSCFLTEKNK